MPRIGIAAPALTGHLSPACALGVELSRRGHEVTVFSFIDAANWVRRSGLGFAAVAEEQYPAGSVSAWQERLGACLGSKALRLSIDWFVRGSTAWGADLPAKLRQHGIELLLADQLEPAALSVAEHLGLKHAVLCHALPIHPRPTVPPPFLPWSNTRGPISGLRNFLAWVAGFLVPANFNAPANRLRKQWGLPPLPMQVQVLPRYTTIAQIPAWFDFPRRMPASFHYTSHWRRPAADEHGVFPWQRLDGRPLVYASLGTLQNRVDRIFQTIALACNGTGVQLVLGLGARRELPSALPGDPIVVPFAPQLELLKRSALVITHAGLNTVMETMAAGVPMIAIPMSQDHPGIAARLHRHQLAQVIPPAKLSVEKLRQAVLSVLSDQEMKQRSFACAERLARVNGTSLAADLVEQACRQNGPVLRFQTQSAGV